MVRAGAAFEPVLALGEGGGRGRARDGEDVGAGGADWGTVGGLAGGVLLVGWEGKGRGKDRGAFWWLGGFSECRVWGVGFWWRVVCGVRSFQLRQSLGCIAILVCHSTSLDGHITST